MTNPSITPAQAHREHVKLADELIALVERRGLQAALASPKLIQHLAGWPRVALYLAAAYVAREEQLATTERGGPT